MLTFCIHGGAFVNLSNFMERNLVKAKRCPSFSEILNLSVSKIAEECWTQSVVLLSAVKDVTQIKVYFGGSPREPRPFNP